MGESARLIVLQPPPCLPQFGGGAAPSPIRGGLERGADGDCQSSGAPPWKRRWPSGGHTKGSIRPTPHVVAVGPVRAAALATGASDTVDIGRTHAGTYSPVTSNRMSQDWQSQSVVGIWWRSWPPIGLWAAARMRRTASPRASTNCRRPSVVAGSVSRDRAAAGGARCG